MKKSKPILITVLTLVVLLSSYVAIAADYGSKDDPLVSLSYIKDVLMPDTLSNVDKLVEESAQKYISSLDEKMKMFEKEFESSISNDTFIKKVAEKVNEQSNSSKVIDVKAGQTLTINSGSEFLVRTGSVKNNSSSIVNITTGENATSNISLNNLYLAVENNQSLSISSDSKIIVFGTYKVS